MKKILSLVILTATLLASSLNVEAAGLKDVFSAKYYADRYADLKAAFGYDEEMLYQHFLDYGLEEGRNMSPILNVKEYREKYADLDVAFGDNWDAYVQHFLDYGINENRDSGTNFDVKTYIQAYDDIAEAFGDDFFAVVEHYLTFGMDENRTKGDSAVYEAELKAKQDNSGGDNVETRPGEYEKENIYDEEGRVIRVNYIHEGALYYYDLYEYNEDGTVAFIYYYGYFENESYFIGHDRYEYGDGGRKILNFYDADGNIRSIFNYVGDFLESRVFFSPECDYVYFYEYTGVFAVECEYRETLYDYDGNVVAVYYYDANGNIIETEELN